MSKIRSVVKNNMAVLGLYKKQSWENPFRISLSGLTSHNKHCIDLHCMEINNNNNKSVMFFKWSFLSSTHTSVWLTQITSGWENKGIILVLGGNYSMTSSSLLLMLIRKTRCVYINPYLFCKVYKYIQYMQWHKWSLKVCCLSERPEYHSDLRISFLSGSISHQPEHPSKP